jgi:hypothetical protein
MRVLLDTKFDFIKEDKYAIRSVFLEPFPFSYKYNVEFEIMGRYPRQLEVIFMDEEKNFICVKHLPEKLKQIANVNHINATEMLIVTDTKAIINLKISK